MTISVIGAGFGRTGTSALKEALEIVGLGPCCHGSEGRHFQQGAEFWERIFNREPVDWDSYFAGYRSTVDSPSCRLYLDLAQHFPAAKIILTTRDPNAWYESYKETILPMLTSSKDRKLLAFLFGSVRHDRRSMIAAYERHNMEVRRRIPPERLLVYDVHEGWSPLCRFLNVPEPAAPFPHNNSRGEFASAVENIGRQLQSTSN